MMLGRDGDWVRQFARARDALGSIGADVADLDAHVVTGITAENHLRMLQQAEGLDRHMASGGRVRSVLGRPEAVQAAAEMLRGVRVNGQIFTSRADLAVVIRWVQVQRVLVDAESLWGPVIRTLGPSFAQRRDALEAAVDELGRVLRIRERLDAFNGAIARVPGLLGPDWLDEQSLNLFVHSLDQAKVIQDEIAAKQTLDHRLQPLKQIAGGPEVDESVEAALLSIQTRDLQGYALSLAQFSSLKHVRERVAVRDRGIATLRLAIPKTVDAMRLDPGDPGWDIRAASITAAWEWRRASTWLATTSAARPMNEVAAAIVRVDDAIRAATGAIAENLAWQHALSRLDGAASSNLRAYQAEMAQYGKGTGRRAPIHLAAARRFLDACQDSVPVWIMPTHLVAETVKARAGQFDVVIVDEASQSGVDSSFSFG